MGGPGQRSKRSTCDAGTYQSKRRENLFNCGTEIVRSRVELRCRNRRDNWYQFGRNYRDQREPAAVIRGRMDAERELAQLAFGQLWKCAGPESRHDKVSQRLLEFYCRPANPIGCLSVGHQLLVGVERHTIEFAVSNRITFVSPRAKVLVQLLVKCPWLDRLRMSGYNRSQTCFERPDCFRSRSRGFCRQRKRHILNPKTYGTA